MLYVSFLDTLMQTIELKELFLYLADCKISN